MHGSLTSNRWIVARCNLLFVLCKNDAFFHVWIELLRHEGRRTSVRTHGRAGGQANGCVEAKAGRHKSREEQLRHVQKLVES